MPTLEAIVVNEEKKQVVTPYSKEDIIKIVNDAIESGQIVIEGGGGGGGSGGEQPTLFAPFITVSGNQVSWVEDTNNGGFETTTTASVDGNVVTSPLTLNASLDKKTLVVKTSAEYFKDGVSTEELNYIGVEPVPYKVVAVFNSFRTDNYALTNYPYIRLRAIIYATDNATVQALANKAKFNYKGIDYLIDGQLNGSYAAYTKLTFQIIIPSQAGRQEIEFYFEITDDCELPENTQLVFRFDRTNNNHEGFRPQGTNYNTGQNGEMYGFEDDNPIGVYTDSDGAKYDTIPLTGKKGVYTCYLEFAEV